MSQIEIKKSTIEDLGPNAQAIVKRLDQLVEGLTGKKAFMSGSKGTAGHLVPTPELKEAMKSHPQCSKGMRLLLRLVQEHRLAAAAPKLAEEAPKKLAPKKLAPKKKSGTSTAPK